jgi:uncharacterized protein (TIGR02145 family)
MRALTVAFLFAITLNAFGQANPNYDPDYDLDGNITVNDLLGFLATFGTPWNSDNITMGCTYSDYLEFNIDANTDDGSCSTLITWGCTNLSAENYNFDANSDDGSCILFGCTDESASNYDTSATVDDGSCDFWSCGDPISYQGHDYSTVIIGDQCWFSENLRNEYYHNGDPISSGLTDPEWTSSNTGATSVYGEDSGCGDFSPNIDACDPSQSLAEYGRLYNWYAVVDDRELCRSGWHVPTDEEWMIMEMALGMSESEALLPGWRGDDIGAAMKTENAYGWYQNSYGTNESGFSGLPGGDRYSWGYFNDAGRWGNWWSSSANGSSYAWCRQLYTLQSAVSRMQESKMAGFSVRCIKTIE